MKYTKINFDLVQGNGIWFDAETHTYRNSVNQRYVSGTKFVSLYKAEFDEEFWKLYKAYQYSLGIPDERKKEFSSLLTKNGFKWGDKPYTIEHLNEVCSKFMDIVNLSTTVVDVKEQWKAKSKAATDKGTKFHNEKENETRERMSFWEQWQGVDYVLTQLDRGIYPEMMLYNHKNRICGTSDKIIFLNKREFAVRDYKTSKTIEFDNKYGDKMKYPLNMLLDCNYNHYNLQLSLYAWMLEQFGYICKSIKIDHAFNVGTEERPFWRKKTYQGVYMHKQMEDLIEHYRENHLKRLTETK